MNLRGGGSNHRDQHGKGDRLVDSQADGQHFVSLGEHSDHHKVLSDELRCRTPISAGDGVAPAVNASRFAAISWSQERQTTMDDRFDDKRRGGAYGLFIGDALAMPVHWYYNRHRLATDYGRVTDYLAPRNPHPTVFCGAPAMSPPILWVRSCMLKPGIGASGRSTTTSF
jgi:hypothetical protein